MKQAATKIVNGISILLLILAVIILLSSVLTGSGKIPQVGGYSVFRVITGSMEPEIKTDSLILVDRIEDEETYEIEKNEIICFYSTNEETAGMTTTHRVVDIKGKGENRRYVTKGDANALADKDEVRPDQIIGIVKWDSHILGVVIKLLMNPWVFFPFIVLPLLIMIILNLIDSVRTAKRLAKEEEEAAVREVIERYKEREKNPDENL